MLTRVVPSSYFGTEGHFAGQISIYSTGRNKVAIARAKPRAVLSGNDYRARVVQLRPYTASLSKSQADFPTNRPRARVTHPRVLRGVQVNPIETLELLQ